MFITVCETDILTPGQIILKTTSGKKFTLAYDKNSWEVGLDFPSTEGMEYKSFKTKWDNKPVQRLILTHKKPSRKAKHSFVLK
jgi:hypothetical protein